MLSKIIFIISIISQPVWAMITCETGEGSKDPFSFICYDKEVTSDIDKSENAFDRGTLAELNDTATQIWNELESNGYTVEQYLNVKPLANRQLDKEYIKKISELKLNIASYIKSGEFNTRLMAENAAKRKDSRKLKVHPFLSQLFLENMLNLLLKDWPELLRTKPEYAWFLPTVVERYLPQNGLNIGAYANDSYFEKHKEVYGQVDAFAKNVLFVSMFEDLGNQKNTSIGLHGEWTRLSLVYVYIELTDRKCSWGKCDHKILSYDPVSTIISYFGVLTFSGNTQLTDSTVNSFIKKFQLLQARYK